MCAQGYQVTLIERNPLMALLLKDAMQRLSETAWCNHNELVAPRVVNANTIDLMSSENLESDCVYLDPMFPKKKKKFAKTNKYMQFLQWLVGADADADSLLAAAINSGCPRIAVKRPDYAKPLMDDIIQPNECFSSKLVHYDVYLNPRHNILKPN